MSFFNSIQFCFLHFFQISVLCPFTPTQCCQPHKLVESGLITYCPCQLKTGPVSQKQIHMSIVHTLLFTSSLIIVQSRIFRMCGFCSSSTTMFSARTTNFLHWNDKFDNTRTSNCFAESLLQAPHGRRLQESMVSLTSTHLSFTSVIFCEF